MLMLSYHLFQNLTKCFWCLKLRGVLKTKRKKKTQVKIKQNKNMKPPYRTQTAVPSKHLTHSAAPGCTRTVRG